MSWEIRQGDAVDRLREMPDESVHCCVTSPPYWGLRDYGVDGQLGHEETPGQFVSKMVEVFAGVRRVLRADGTLWLNIGDSYWSAKGTPGGEKAWRDGSNADEKNPARRFGKRPQDGPAPAGLGIKPKDLVGIPWMLAFALRADGWYLRSDIIWAKPNPMPESVTDRPTKSHEYLFLLTKSPRYFYDAEAIREGWADGREGDAGARGTYAEGAGRGGGGDKGLGVAPAVTGRNKRSVWTIATKPFAGAHFATFPPDLVEPCVKAGTPPKVCGECGAPWRRLTKRERLRDGEPLEGSWTEPDQPRRLNATGVGHWRDETRVETLGWEPTCDHTDDSGCVVVLDPFSGAATTGLVATKLGRDFVGIELNPEYVALGEVRIRRWEHDPAGRLGSTPSEIQGQVSILDLLEQAA